MEEKGKDPVLPLYYTDIVASTLTWTDEEFGSYVRLLIYQWDKGEIPKDSNRRLKISETSERHWPVLKEKFKGETTTGIYNHRLKRIYEKRQQLKGRKTNNTKSEAQDQAPVTSKAEPVEEIEITQLWPTFEDFWLEYDKKVGDRERITNKWNKLKATDKEAIMNYLPEYKKAQPDKKFRKNPETFLNNKTWNDELIYSTPNNGNSEKQQREQSIDDLQRQSLRILTGNNSEGTKRSN